MTKNYGTVKRLSRRSRAQIRSHEASKRSDPFRIRPSALVAGRDLNPRPLGYEPYDARLLRPRPSLADVRPRRTGQIPSRSVGFVSPVSHCLAASGLQIGLQNRRLICSSCTPRLPSLGAAGTVSGLVKRLPSGAASTHDASFPVVPDAGPFGAPSRHHRYRVCTGHRPHRCLVQTPFPEPGCCWT
jgi:hypothetical protein